MNADEQIYGRYGGRDAASAESRMSLAGLKYAMEAALAAHRRPAKPKSINLAKRPQLIEQYAAAKGRQGCIHCHNIYQFRHADWSAAGQWRKEFAWTYPLPDNVGLSLEVDVGNRVRSVALDSPAHKVGLRAGDLLESMNGIAVASLADAQHGLHRAPEKGQLPVSWLRDGKKMTGILTLADGWRRSDLSWRRSATELVSSFIVRGPDLSPAEKKALGLDPTRLAFRVQKPILLQPEQAGVKENDVVLGIDNQTLQMTADQFTDYLRGYYQAGERVTLNLIRNGMPFNLPVTLR
jgi:hypothetical protein